MDSLDAWLLLTLLIYFRHSDSPIKGLGFPGLHDTFETQTITHIDLTFWSLENAINYNYLQLSFRGLNYSNWWI